MLMFLDADDLVDRDLAAYVIGAKPGTRCIDGVSRSGTGDRLGETPMPIGYWRRSMADVRDDMDADHHHGI
jgi:hypothetical protein